MKKSSRGLALFALAGAALLAASCGGGNDTPSGSTPPGGGSAQVTPTPTSTPVPTATPAPAFGFSCGLGPGPGSGEGCPRETANFTDQVNAAIDLLGQQQPQIFDFNDTRGAGGWRVLSIGAYVTGVVRNMEKQGFCATWDGEELQVKNSNDFNDQYHILLSSGHVRRGDGQYRATCSPAAFPKSSGVPGQVPGCSLPGSRELACGREPSSRYYTDIEWAIDELIRTRPELFDLNDTQPGTNWPMARDGNAYHQGLITVLAQRGYCGRFDGIEIQVKKVNDFNEQFDVHLASGYVRRGEGIYRSSCYPAAF
ncbi:MAG: hypothetical protein NDJ94_16435 [Vicinamibacteria bacterium]|nr:hypothetical protein [Vicinamibacteria bacterium]